MTTGTTNAPLSVRLKRIPGFFGIRLDEGPKYYVLMKEDNKQIRKYYPYLMAQTFVRGSYEFATNEGFYRLANYLFGANSTGEKMSMVSPILQSRSKKLIMSSPILQQPQTDGWMMSFILPHKLKLETAPKPLMDNIKLVHVPSLIVASLRYRGANTELKMSESTAELLDWVDALEDFNIISEPRFAQYDGTQSMPFMRRNEVQVTVQEIPRLRKRPH